ncbi:MAG: hypothetical protein AB1782_12695, partial [Cyanobacteriota bacterium]
VLYKVVLSIVLMVFLFECFILDINLFNNNQVNAFNQLFNEKLIAQNPVNIINSSEKSKHKKLTTGTLKGSINAPVKKCSNGYCIIDFGDYIMTGIPENYNEVLETTGNSGANNPAKLIDSDITDKVIEKINLDNMDINNLIDLDILK